MDNDFGLFFNCLFDRALRSADSTFLETKVDKKGPKGVKNSLNRLLLLRFAPVVCMGDEIVAGWGGVLFQFSSIMPLAESTFRCIIVCHGLIV